MIFNFEMLMFVLWHIFDITNFDDFFFGGHYFNKLNGLQGVNLETSDVLIIRECIVYSFDVGVL